MKLLETPGATAHLDGMLRICAVFVLSCLPFCALADLAGPVRVIDADTWDVGGERVRLFGIDAPELAQTCKNRQGRNWACGSWVSDRVRRQYDGRAATCERLGKDRYQRTIARCFVGHADVARVMVSDGLAFAYRRYSLDYVPDEKIAALNARGLHAGQVVPPADFRAAGKALLTVPASGTCLIKGNLSSNDERIYHLPGQRSYQRTRISPTKGERWFCSENQARDAGWRAALR